MDEELPDFGLLAAPGQNEKFGIENEQINDFTASINDKTQDASNPSILERSSLSSTTSSTSMTGTFSQYLPTSLQRTTGQGYVGMNTSDGETKSVNELDILSQFKSQSNYMALEDDLPDCLASEHSSAGDNSSSLSSVFANISASQTPVKTAGDERQCSKDWIVFDELEGSANKEHAQDELLSPSKKTIALPRPPEIPLRKVVSSSNTSSPSFDLLSMDTDMLTEHLHRASPQTVSDQAVPPIPARLMSPLQSKPSSPVQTFVPSPIQFDIRIPPPISSGNTGRRSQRNTPKQAGKSSNGPPIPPRKELAANQSKTPARKLDMTAVQWVQFEDKSKELSGNDETLLQPVSLTENLPQKDNLLSLQSISVENIVETDSGVLAVSDNNLAPDGDLWRPVSPSSATSSLRSSKKRKGGYHHLSDDEEDKIQSAQSEEKCPVEIKVTDLSPAKPLSAWAPIRNEENAGSSGNVSLHNSIMDDITQDDLDEEFADNANRLTGFNRADKGSQNNLVDFSESAEHLQTSAPGSGCSSLDGDVETIFDMTAQGDSLKRRIRKKSSDSAAPTTPTFQVGAENSRRLSAAEKVSELNSMAKKAEPTEAANLLTTNPFWCASPHGDTVSVTSSTSEINPFEKVQFQSTAPGENMTPVVAKQPSAGIPLLPPPPSAGKVRSQTGSLRKVRERISSASKTASNLQQNTGRAIENPSTPTILDFPLEQSPSTIASPVKHPTEQTVAFTKETAAPLVDLGLRLDVPDGTAGKQEDMSGDTLDGVSVASTSKQGNILETTLSILDVFSKPSEETPLSPISIEETDIKTYHATDMEPTFPQLKENSLDSLDKLQKSVSVESPVEIAEKGEDKLSSFSDYDLVPEASEWKMLMRFPREKRRMSSRKWVSIYIRLDTKKVQRPYLQLYHNSNTTDPFFFLSLAQHDWQITDPVLQARFYNSGSLEESDMEAAKRKVHTVKLLYIQYKEKHAFMSKQDQLMLKTPSGFKHSMKGRQAMKLGTENYNDLLSLLFAVRDASFAANSLSLNKKESDPGLKCQLPLMNFHSRDEIVFNVQDQFRGVTSAEGKIEACCVRVHVFVTSFLSGDPDVTVTFNDKRVEGCEVVRREDILPSSNTHWVALSDVELHRCNDARGYDAKSASVTFRPPDACRFELLRFRCPYAEPELPVSVKALIVAKGTRVFLRCVLRSGGANSANKDPLTQVPCEDVSVRFYVPENWTPAFRRPGKFRIRSVHAKRIVRRPPGPISPQNGGVVKSHAILEASVGSAKYEVAYGAIVWRIGRFPEKNAAFNTPQVLSCKIDLTTEGALPDPSAFSRYEHCDVEYKMPSATASNACLRSVNLPKNEKADKFVSYEAHYMYKVGVSILRENDDSGNEKSCSVQ